MKLIFIKIPLLLMLVCSTVFAQVGIGTIEPDASAALDIEATDKGLLPPRMTGDDRDQINSPAQGLMIYCTNCGSDGEMQVYNGDAWVNLMGGDAAPPVITSATGKIWMDRNLGASQVATTSTDTDAYGHLYQWGRAADGHQLRDSETSSGPVASGDEGSNFITNNSSPNDWLTSQDNGRWNTGTELAPIKTSNDPCPSDYRIPTNAEWQAELDAPNGISNAQSAFEILKLPLAGYRGNISGSLFNVNTNAYYWSSTINSTGSGSRVLYFLSNGVSMVAGLRASGYSVRCLKD